MRPLRCLVLVAFTVWLLALPAHAWAQCDANARPGGAAGYTAGDLNGNLGDYGALFYDAQDPSCFLQAARQLKSMVTAELNDPNGFRGWLGGGDVYLVMATALVLGGRTDFTDFVLRKQLDDLVYAVSRRYTAALSCDTSSGNTCMEDYATAAAAYAWIAAYERLSGRSYSSYAQLAKSNLGQSFSLTQSVCVRVKNLSNPTANCSVCEQSIGPGQRIESLDALYNGINQGTIEVVSYNGVATEYGPLGENPNYGVGILSSVAAAATGLDVTGSGWYPGQEVRLLAHGLVRQGQRRTDGFACSATWSSRCYNRNPAYPVCAEIASCADPSKSNSYRPTMYPIRDFVNSTLAISGQLMLDDQFGFDCGDGFSSFSAGDGFFHDGRLAVYRDLGSTWRTPANRPALATLRDRNAPLAYIDAPANGQAVSGATTFVGWAIDRESGVTVSLSIDGMLLSGMAYGVSRPDVCAAFGIVKDPWCSVGWSGPVDTTAFANGPHTLTLTAKDASGNTSQTSRTFTTQNAVCSATARTIWIQPQWRAGFGPAGSLIVAGSASASPSCGTGGVELYWRRPAPPGSLAGWNVVSYAPLPDANGIWVNAIENADPLGTYEVLVTFRGSTPSYCTYDGRNDIVWCQ